MASLRQDLITGYCSPVGFATLPDEVLLKVLAFLSPRQLLLVRRVCRQWRDLALDPWVWECQDVCASDLQLAASVLRLAPCLRRLSVGEEEWNKFSSVCGVLLATSSCAVRKLDMTFLVFDATIAALLVAKQGSLGRLEEVKVEVQVFTQEEYTVYNSRLHDLSQQLLYTKGLKKVELMTTLGADKSYLAVEAAPLLNAAQRLEAPPPASLRGLTIQLVYLLPLFFEWHATTLEVVQLCDAFPGAASLLATLPRLRDLTCPVMPDLLALLRCPALKSLELIIRVREDTRPHLAETRALLLAAAPRLEEVTLVFVDDDAEEAADLVSCVAGVESTIAALKSLTVDGPAGVLRPLASTLHRLPNLVKLQIGEPTRLQGTDAFLEALDRQAVPKLKELRALPSEGCMHEWAHSEQVRSLLKRCPGLRLAMHEHWEEPKDECAYCAEHVCHSCLRLCTVVVSSHSADVDCDVGPVTSKGCIYICVE
ncbi:uncharacterized protein LOC117642159 [Thrips palmi]|uniref:Uncharacterized protein LOC117642159 n=1 Tax=Thrips palmi TaxID=161013 RepID=A0A6P8ZJU1_THRPL|nr:uncharacterized protein LOC117642159 [Thrips palmi]